MYAYTYVHTYTCAQPVTSNGGDGVFLVGSLRVFVSVCACVRVSLCIILSYVRHHCRIVFKRARTAWHIIYIYIYTYYMTACVKARLCL